MIKPMLAIKVTRFLIKSLFRRKVKRPPVGLLDVQGQCRSLSVESQCFYGFREGSLFSVCRELSACRSSHPSVFSSENQSVHSLPVVARHVVDHFGLDQAVRIETRQILQGGTEERVDLVYRYA